MKMKRAAILFLTLLGVLSVAADWVAPYQGNLEFRHLPHHPPTRIHFVDESGRFFLKPFVYRTEMNFDENHARVYTEDQSRKYFLKTGAEHLVSAEAPAHLFFCGTDARGRDLFSRILFGARTSLSIGLLGALLSTFLGFLIGSIAGYFGGRTDTVLMRFAEFFIMIPGFYFLLALRSALQPDLSSTQVYLLTVIVLSLIGWGGVARVIRGLVLSISKNEFVTAAQVLGCSHRSILRKHIFPHTRSYIMVVLSVSVPSFILAESALSLLGLGIMDPGISWGSLLTEAMSVAHLQLHPWVIIPGFVLAATAFCFNFLGDSLQQEDFKA